jgi:hypothetical protein
MNGIAKETKPVVSIRIYTYYKLNINAVN